MISMHYMQANHPRIAIVAGEASGDQLGAGLIRQLKAELPRAKFYGVGGPLMQAQGFDALYPMQAISMIGLEGVFTKLPKIIAIRQRLINLFKKQRPDIFIGIDVPDFNLGLEKKLTRHAILCVHYVSPTIWAWRSNRIKTIKQAVAHMLVLFPFEQQIYEKQGIPVTFVGHPIAAEVDRVPDSNRCRASLGLPREATIIALLPGSRQSEIERHAHLFLQTAQYMSGKNEKLKFLISATDAQAAAYIGDLVDNDFQRLDVGVISEDVRRLISASDLVLAASGTVTLETALMKKPLVMAYKVSKLSEIMVRFFAQVDYYAMPNFLLDTPLVPEFVQDHANPENLASALFDYLDNQDKQFEIVNKFKKIKEILNVNSNQIAADVIKSYLPEIQHESGRG